MPVWEKELREKLRELNREVTQYAVGHLIGGLRDANRDLPQVARLSRRGRARHHRQRARLPAPADAAGRRRAAPNPTMATDPEQPPSFRRYRVNVIVDQSGAKGAPVVYEDIPSLPNLIGRIEHLAQFGALITDFNLIKPGALHRANGGYLLIDARKLLIEPFAWEELKRAMRAEEIRIDGLAQRLSIVSTVSLEPEPIPLDVKIVLVGDRTLYHLLERLRPGFRVAVQGAGRVQRPDGFDAGSGRRLCAAHRQAGRGARSCGRSIRPASRASSSMACAWPTTTRS